MCLKIKSGPHVANKNLYVLKLAEELEENYFHTFFRGFKMEYGKGYTAKIRPNKRDKEVDKGLHALVASQLRSYTSWISFVSFDDYYISRGIILCRIPKETIYYLGTNADIVSEKLIPLYPVLLNRKRGMFTPTEGYDKAEGKHFELKYLATHNKNSVQWIEDIIEVYKTYNIELL